MILLIADLQMIDGSLSMIKIEAKDLVEVNRLIKEYKDTLRNITAYECSRKIPLEVSLQIQEGK